MEMLPPENRAGNAGRKPEGNKKNVVVNNCQKLLTAVHTVYHNMDELVAKIEGKYGTANRSTRCTEVDQQDCR
jgi:hypothetical protein